VFRCSDLLAGVAKD
ncbi:transposase, IS4 family protein, partial [Gloeomargarita lithophora Alchichica-D10]